MFLIYQIRMNENVRTYYHLTKTDNIHQVTKGDLITDNKKESFIVKKRFDKNERLGKTNRWNKSKRLDK